MRHTLKDSKCTNCSEMGGIPGLLLPNMEQRALSVLSRIPSRSGICSLQPGAKPPLAMQVIGSKHVKPGFGPQEYGNVHRLKWFRASGPRGKVVCMFKTV